MAAATAEAVRPETAAEEPKKKAVRQLETTRMQTGDFLRNLFVVTAHDGTDPEDLLQLDYWANVAEKFRPFDKIEARADDGSWYAEYLVIECDRAWARLAVLTQLDLNRQPHSTETRPKGEFRVEFKGPHRKWAVIRNSDNAIVKDELTSRSEGEAWVSTRMRAGL